MREPTNIEKTMFQMNDLCTQICEEKGGLGQLVSTLTGSVLLNEKELAKKFLNDGAVAQPYHLMSAVMHNVPATIDLLLDFNEQLPYQPNERGVTTIDLAKHLIANVPSEKVFFKGSQYLLDKIEFRNCMKSMLNQPEPEPTTKKFKL